MSYSSNNANKNNNRLDVTKETRDILKKDQITFEQEYFGEFIQKIILTLIMGRGDSGFRNTLDIIFRVDDLLSILFEMNYNIYKNPGLKNHYSDIIKKIDIGIDGGQESLKKEEIVKIKNLVYKILKLTSSTWKRLDKDNKIRFSFKQIYEEIFKELLNEMNEKLESGDSLIVRQSEDEFSEDEFKVQTSCFFNLISASMEKDAFRDAFSSYYNKYNKKNKKNKNKDKDEDIEDIISKMDKHTFLWFTETFYSLNEDSFDTLIWDYVNKGISFTELDIRKYMVMMENGWTKNGSKDGYQYYQYMYDSFYRSLDYTTDDGNRKISIKIPIEEDEVKFVKNMFKHIDNQKYINYKVDIVTCNPEEHKVFFEGGDDDEYEEKTRIKLLRQYELFKKIIENFKKKAKKQYFKYILYEKEFNNQIKKLLLDGNNAYQIENQVFMEIEEIEDLILEVFPNVKKMSTSGSRMIMRGALEYYGSLPFYIRERIVRHEIYEGLKKVNKKDVVILHTEDSDNEGIHYIGIVGSMRTGYNYIVGYKGETEDINDEDKKHGKFISYKMKKHDFSSKEQFDIITGQEKNNSNDDKEKELKNILNEKKELDIADMEELENIITWEISWVSVDEKNLTKEDIKNEIIDYYINRPMIPELVKEDSVKMVGLKKDVIYYLKCILLRVGMEDSAFEDIFEMKEFIKKSKK